MVRYFLGVMLAGLALAGIAADECDVEREVQAAATRRMSRAQQDQIHDQAILLCSRRETYARDRKTVQHDRQYIDDMNRLIVSYCGSDPDSVGRGQRCRQDKAKLEEYIATTYDDNVKTMLANEKRIKMQELSFEKLKNAKPLPERKVDPALLAKRAGAAAIAKVKEDILESLKDPGSAQFRRIVVSAEGGIVCGEVNAKNAMGGYIGFKKFVNIEDRHQDFTYYEDSNKPGSTALCEGPAQK